MEHLIRDIAIHGCVNIGAAEDVRGCNTKGKGRKWSRYTRLALTGIDRLRRPPTAPRIPPRSSRYYLELARAIPCRAQTDTDTIMRLPGGSGAADDRVEGCTATDFVHAGQQSGEHTMRPRVFACPTRRGHRGTQDQPHSMSGRISIHPPFVSTGDSRTVSARCRPCLIRI